MTYERSRKGRTRKCRGHLIGAGSAAVPPLLKPVAPQLRPPMNVCCSNFTSYASKRSKPRTSEGLSPDAPFRIACAGAPGRQIFHPEGLADGLTKSRADNFRLIPANSAVRDVLRVHAQSQIARIRADFERFSKKCRKEWTEWWSKRDLNSRPLFIKYPVGCAVSSAQFRRILAIREFVRQ